VRLRNHKHRLSEETNNIAQSVLLVLLKVLQTECIRTPIWNDDTRQLLLLGRNFVVMFQTNGKHLSFSSHCLENTF